MLRSIVGVLLAIAPTAFGGSVNGDPRRDGAFGFPQKDATVLCDTDTLRVSAFSDADYLYVQAILFTDSDDSLGETEDGRKIGDSSTLQIDADADGKATGDLDRSYCLNPWPSLPGLGYQVVFDENSNSGIQSDSKGRGAISYVDAGEGRRVRVDCYLIPLAELKRTRGQAIRLAYWGSSPKP